MIDVSSLTQMAQTQPVPVDLPRAVTAVSEVQKNSPAGSQMNGQSSDSNRYPKYDDRHATRQSSGGLLDSNVVANRDRSLQFRIDQDSDRLVVSLLDSQGEVIRQMPSEMILRLAQRLEEIRAEGKLGLDQMA